MKNFWSNPENIALCWFGLSLIGLAVEHQLMFAIGIICGTVYQMGARILLAIERESVLSDLRNEYRGGKQP